jgi:hypothetical protein
VSITVCVLFSVAALCIIGATSSFRAARTLQNEKPVCPLCRMKPCQGHPIEFD